MTAVIPDLLHPAVLAATKAKSTSSGSSMFFIFLLVIAVAAYFLFLRPQQQKARRQRAMQSDINEGDEVVTVGGIVGRVVKMEEDRVHLLIGYHKTATADATEHAPHRMTFVRNAISRKVEPPAADPVANGSGELDEFSFEDDGEDGFAENGFAENGFSENGFSEDGFSENGFSENGFADENMGDEVVEDEAVDGHVNGNGAVPDERPTGRGRGRGRRAGGGAKGSTSQ